jgi:hypothetical protein
MGELQAKRAASNTAFARMLFIHMQPGWPLSQLHSNKKRADRKTKRILLETAAQ